MGPPLSARSRNLTVRITPSDKEIIERAARAVGEDVTTFLLSPALVRARDILDRETVTVLTDSGRALFAELMEKSPSDQLMRNFRDDRHEIVD